MILQPNYTLIAATCNTFRVYGDIYDAAQSIGSIVGWYGENPGNFSDVVAPGSFTDADMVSDVIAPGSFTDADMVSDVIELGRLHGRGQCV